MTDIIWRTINVPSGRIMHSAKYKGAALDIFETADSVRFSVDSDLINALNVPARSVADAKEKAIKMVDFVESLK